MASSAVIEDRHRKVSDLKCYLKSVEDKLKFITDELNWSYENLLRGTQDTTVTCTICLEHRVHASRIKDHEEKCKWSQDGYHTLDAPLPDSFGHDASVTFTRELLDTVIRNACSNPDKTLDNDDIELPKYSKFNAPDFYFSDILVSDQASNQGVPQTSARFDQEFTREEKLALYDYVISNTKGQKLYTDITTLVAAREDDDKNKIMTPLEIAAAERDAKRRRASYRNKVHTNRKTQTEVLREVIDSQMEMLREEICQNEMSTQGKEEAVDCDGNKHDHRRKSSSSHPREHSSEHSSTRFHKTYNDHYVHDDRHGKHRSSKQSQHGHDKDIRHSRHKKEKKRKRSRSRSRDRSKRRRSHTGHHSGSHRD